MKKKKVLKGLLSVLFIALLIFFIYNLFFLISRGKNNVEILLDNNAFIGSNVNATLKVYNRKAPELLSLKSSVKVSLYDSNDKKVKGTKEEKYECEEAEEINVDYKIPDNIEPGKYTLKFKVHSSKGFDTFEKQIYIKNSFTHNLVISLDKGIYKPGDEVNFRGMLLSKNDCTPVSGDLNVSIYDGNSNKVYSENVKTSEYGITSGTFNLASEVNSGIYKLVFTLNNEEFSKEFQVNPYITPKYGVEVSKSKDNLKVDEETIITVKGEYFFGEPVKNADVEVDIDGEKTLGITNSDGIYEFSYTPKKEGVYPISVKVTDESNYMVESKTSISCSQKAFKIEILPEYGDLIKNVNNDIYVYTKKVDGTPVKTYSTLKIGKISRQVITDENGIGMISLSSSDISSLSRNTVSIQIESKDMSEEVVNETITANLVTNSGTLIRTNKVKYNQGEDIEVELESSKNRSKNTIYVLKNSTVIQKITTDEESIKVNLDDENGLITLFSLKEDGKDFENKKTIFIKPEKSLSVDIDVDEEEYKPGDKMMLDLELKDENGNSVDGAILVSILDEAVQNLAQNDLSIDNLMLALKDISFGDGIDLASVYATILEDKDDTILTGLLLKQSVSIPSMEQSYNQTDTERYVQNFIYSVLGLCLFILIFITVKSKNVRIVVKELIAFLCWSGIYTALFTALLGFLGGSSLYRIIFFSNIGVLVFIAYIVGLLFVYIKYLTKNKDKFITNLVAFAWIPLLALSTIYSVFETVIYAEDFEEIIGFLICIALIIITGITIIVLGKQGKINLKSILKKLCIGIFIVGIGLIFGEDELVLYGIITDIIAVVVVTFIEIYNSGNKEKNKKEIKIVIDTKMVIGIVLGLLIFAIMSGIHSITHNFASNIADSPSPSYIDGGIPNSSGFTEFSTYDYEDTTGASSSVSKSNIFSNFSLDIFSQSSGSTDTVLSEMDNSSTKSDTNKEEVVDDKITSEDENIRNVFLESLSFIPEIITENGKASQEIKLSDNITTWQIQTIANTKDGRIGYGSKDVKVFKEFFVDFSLPTNSVVGDKVSIPVTIYNYKNDSLTVSLSVKEEKWFKLGEFNKEITVNSESTALVYIPIEILSDGNNKFRVEAKSSNVTDIMELAMTVTPNGVKVSKVVNSGSFENDINLDVIYTEPSIENTNNLKVKLYPSTMTTVIENIDNIFKMPTGCFEQTSSGLYPDIVALRYLEQNEIDNQKLKEKALGYINSGYQRLLTFEVKGTPGGYSLYGKSPAEPVLTAYGLMELKDLSTVYEVDNNVLERMRDYLFGIQNTNGSFDMNGNSTYSTGHVVGDNDTFKMNAYITWALSEAYPDDSRLENSIEYIEKNYSSKAKDNYTLALVANIFANTKNSNTNKVISALAQNVKTEDNKAYLTSDSYDYWGSRGNIQNLQATALTSLAFSKTGKEGKTNKLLIEYILNRRDTYGTWGNTQATILSLKALNEYSSKSKISDQEIKVTLNKEEQIINVSKNSLDLYEVDFDNVDKECKLKIDSQKGELYYEVVQEYYLTYDEFSKTKENVMVNSKMTTECSVNDVVEQDLEIVNNGLTDILNGMIEISIPQGCSVREESLSKLETLGYIEKYEYNYGKIYLYLRNFNSGVSIETKIEYNANYPETITGGLVRVYDYYNPEIEGYCMPVVLNVQ